MVMPCLDDWLQTPQGQYLLAWEARKFDLLVADLFGFNALQIGFAKHDFLQCNRMPFHLSCSLSSCDAAEEGQSARIFCEPTELPFASQSVDLIVLPHVLEFSPSAHQILRELERVLVPEGSVVISGFNPFSMWGLRRVFAGNMGQLPWTGQFLSIPRLKDWLSLLGFEMRLGAFGCYAPPVSTQKWLKRWSFMDAAGDRWWSFAGGVYMIQAVKKVPGIRLIKPRWKKTLRKKKNMLPAIQSNTPSSQTSKDT